MNSSSLTVAIFNTKGGVGKSLFVEEFKHVLTNRHNKVVSVYNLDPQGTVEELIEEEPDFILVDTVGAFTDEVCGLLSSMSGDENSMIIVPVGTGYSDRKEYEFLIEQLMDHGVFEKSIFVFNKTRHNLKSLTACREDLHGYGATVAKTTIPLLEDFAQLRHTPQCDMHFSKLIKETLLSNEN